MNLQTFDISDIREYWDDIMQELGEDNPDYALSREEIMRKGLVGERIYKRTVKAAHIEFIQDPAGKKGPDTIRVLADSVQIGTIPRSAAGRVKELIEKGDTHGFKLEAEGGPYHMVRKETDAAGDVVYTMIEKEAVPDGRIFRDLDRGRREGDTVSSEKSSGILSSLANLFKK